MRALPLLLLALLSPLSANADDTLRITDVRLDRPTIHTLGVQVLVSDDDDFDGEITVRVRPVGGTYREVTPLFRVHPEHVLASMRPMVPAQFAGSIFDLEPGTDYEIELHAVDADGSVDTTMVIEGTTRPIPIAEAPSPRRVPVTDDASLRAALSGAMAGDVIELAAGTYAGQYSMSASGTADRPIVVRGVGPTTILDGGGCTGCNVIEVYGSYVHVEDLTIRAAERALRFQTDGTTGNVARRLHIDDVVHGIGSRTGQTDFYVCDNDIDGRLVWPWVFDADATSHWDDRGIDLNGNGHVVCHNRIRGFGDPIVDKTPFFRALDVYGNDILDCFDGTELDEATGNVRFWANRWTNVMASMSLQPIYGGPAYVLRNVGLNIPDEQLKLKSLGGVDLPSGVLVWHNTWVSPEIALNLQTPIEQFHFRIENNLFVGPTDPVGRTVEWTAIVTDGVFDFDGYFPDTGYWFGVVGGTNRIYSTLEDARVVGVEPSGVALTLPIFEDAFVGPAGDGSTRSTPARFALAATSNALERARPIAGINSHHGGTGPDLGAWERGCPEPVYGPRPAAMEGVHTLVDCDGTTRITPTDAGPRVDGSVSPSDAGPTTDAGPGLDGGTTPPPPASSCACRARSAATSPTVLAWSLGIVLLIGRRRSRRR